LPILVKFLAVFLICAAAAWPQLPSFRGRQSYFVNESLNQTDGVSVFDCNADGIRDIVDLDSDGNRIFTAIGNGDGTFRKGPVSALGTGYSGTGLFLGDFTGDGVLDVFAGGQSDTDNQGFAILRGNGDCTFTQISFLPVVSRKQPHFEDLLIATIGDFNGDGKLDFITAAYYPNDNLTVYVLYFFPGNGDGTFGTPITTVSPTAIGPSPFVVGDFNNDGHLDFANSYAHGVAVWLGDGTGHFKQTSKIPLNSLLQPVLSGGDVNGDGNFDLIATVASKTTSASQILLGDGTGTFHLGALVPGIHGFLSVGDVNGDGIADLVGEGTSPITYQIAVALGLGDGAFSNPVLYSTDTIPGLPVLADLRNNGLLDIVGGSEETDTVLLNKGNGAYADNPVIPIGRPGCVAVADFNGDGHPDVAMANGDGVRLLFGTGAASSPFRDGPATNFGYQVCERAGDFNNDGIPDLVITTGNIATGTLGIALGKGDGTFTAQPNVSVGGVSRPCVGDFDGDGNLDVATASGFVSFGNGDGTLTPSFALIKEGFFLYCAVVDLNGDGRDDVVLTEEAGVFVFLGQADRTFKEIEYPYLSYAGPLEVGDFNEDGYPDVATMEFEGSRLTVFLGNGDGTLTQGPTLENDTLYNTYQLLAADYNGDGHLDLALPSQYGYFTILTGAGDGTFSISSLYGALGPIEDAAPAALQGQTSLKKADLVQTGGSYFGYLLNTTR